MAKTLYTATDANGVIHTRNSDRVYTHTVVYLHDYTADLAGARNESWKKTDRSNYRYYQKLISGDHGFSCITEADVAKARGHVEGLTEEAFVAREVARRVDRVETNKANGFYKKYFNAGWCGRLDLAQKLVSKYQFGEILSVTAS